MAVVAGRRACVEKSTSFFLVVVEILRRDYSCPPRIFIDVRDCRECVCECDFQYVPHPTCCKWAGRAWLDFTWLCVTQRRRRQRRSKRDSKRRRLEDMHSMGGRCIYERSVMPYSSLCSLCRSYERGPCQNRNRFLEKKLSSSVKIRIICGNNKYQGKIRRWSELISITMKFWSARVIAPPTVIIVSFRLSSELAVTAPAANRRGCVNYFAWAQQPSAGISLACGFFLDCCLR